MINVSKFLEKSRKGKSDFTKSEILNILDILMCLLPEMCNICDGLSENFEICHALEHVVNSPHILSNETISVKLTDCLLYIYNRSKTTCIERKRKEALICWVLNLILSTLKRGSSGNNMTSLLIEVGMQATTVIKEQMKQEIELLCKHVKEEAYIFASKDNNKYQLINNMALQISNLLGISEFYPLLGCILDIWGTIPEEHLDADIFKICVKILEYTGSSENEDFVMLKMKVWKLYLESFEKDILELMEKCTSILPLPTLLSNVIKSSELVKACSRDGQLFHVGYQILYNLVNTTDFSQLTVDIITIFMSTIKQNHIEDKTVRFYPNVCTELQPLSALLSCNPKGMTEHCFNIQIITIMKNIKQLSDNGITYHCVKYQQDFHWLMFDNREWYYSALWHLLSGSKQYLPDFISFIFWCDRLNLDQNLEKILEYVKIVRVLMIKKGLRKEDLEYAMGVLGSTSTYRHVTNYVLFLFLLQSEAGLLLVHDIIKMTDCMGVENTLFMIIQIEQVYNINFCVWSINKRNIFKEFITKSMRELELEKDTRSVNDETNLLCQKYKMLVKSVENMLMRIK